MTEGLMSFSKSKRVNLKSYIWRAKGLKTQEDVSNWMEKCFKGRSRGIRLFTEPIKWYDHSVEVLKGFVEGFLETWCNRYRISNICIFEEEDRKKGFGKILLDEILKEAKNSKARMVVLETQSYNYNAISFYKKNGFEIIGFDMYAYSNDGPKEHNMRIEMGKIL